jgi:hypothetical protein
MLKTLKFFLRKTGPDVWKNIKKLLSSSEKSSF